MTLVDDYLRAVAILLPKSQRDDIVAELRDTILTRLETQEAERGRQPSEDEVEQVLHEMGHPLAVAARYRGGPQHVVGPAIYPYWSFAIQLAIAIQLGVSVVVFIVRSLTGGDVARAFGMAVGSGLGGVAVSIGIATAAAWTIERRDMRIDYLDRWRVRDLRLLEIGAWGLDRWRDHVDTPRTDRRPGRDSARRLRRDWWRASPAAQGIGAITTGVILSLWWAGLLRFGLVDGPVDLAALGLAPGPLATIDWSAISAAVFWPVLTYCMATILQGVLLLAFPRAARMRGLFDIGIGLGVFATTAWIWGYSALAPYIQVASVSGFALRMKALFEGGAPAALAPILTLIVAGTAVGGLGRVISGVWRVLAPEAATRWARA